MRKSFSIDFRAPETAQDLASYIGIDAALFEAVLSEKDKREFYNPLQIPKRSRHRFGKFRTVWEVRDLRLAEAHKAIARRFELFARLSDPRFPHAAAYGYVRHRGTRDNAEVHCGAHLLLRADIRNFFPSISAWRLKKRFLELNMHPQAAEALAKFTTIDDQLALGLNASPMLANLVCVDLDIKLQKLADAYGCKYTRYADDVAMSARRVLPSRAEIEQIFEKEGFQLSGEKFRCTKNGQAHFVTGLSVSDVNGPHVPRIMKRRLRQELYYSKKFGTKDHLARTCDSSLQSGINRLNGTVLYVSHIERRISRLLKSEWDALQIRDRVGASYESLPVDFIQRISCFVDETEIPFGNRRFLALGLAFTDNVGALSTSTLATLRAHRIEDAFYAGDKTALAKKGLHFTDSHPDLRAAYVKALASLPFRAFVIFGELTSDDKYSATYISLLEKLLPKRLTWYDGATIEFIFEENSKIKKSSLEQTVGDVYQLQEETNNRRPFQKPNISVGKKLEHPCFAVSDYLLAIFSRFARADEKPEEKLRIAQFERLRDKYRLIIDGDTGVEFSRKRPFQPWNIAEK